VFGAKRAGEAHGDPHSRERANSDTGCLFGAVATGSNLASIPLPLAEREKEPFDLEYMNALFDVGYDLGRHGYHWQTSCPFLI
jgi:hypothetical protein